ncbi:MAG: glycosyltransferase family 39 protein [Acidobacteriota bacterium]
MTHALMVLLAASFVATGMLFIPRLGIEVDEAIVAGGIYAHGSPWYSWHIGQDELPIMLLSYLGALKTWMYNLLFLVVTPRPMSLRLPTLLLAAGSLWLFFALLDKTVNRSVAWIGAVLLATDTSYLMMNAVDYGPVTLQFVFKLAALVLLVRFHQSGRQWDLAAAFFLLGLAMWDKAVFAWVLFGLAAGAAAVFPREILRHLTFVNLRTAALAMLTGALPLLIYNIDRPLETLRSTAKVEQLAILGKSVILTRALDGYVFFGFVTALDPGPQPGAPGRWYQALSMAISQGLGSPHHSLTLWASAAAVFSLALLWRTSARKPILFGLVTCFATWLPMVLTAGAGAAAQHVILLWPFHLLAIAAAVDRIPLRAAVVGITALLCASSLAVTNQYYVELIRNGPTMRWTDAMDPLHRYLTDLCSTDHSVRHIYVADWGIIETMNLLSQGALPASPADLSGDEGIRVMLRDQASVFVAHAAGQAIHPNERGALEAVAQREQYMQENITTILDRNGRPAFDVFRFRKIHL